MDDENNIVVMFNQKYNGCWTCHCLELIKPKSETAREKVMF